MTEPSQPNTPNPPTRDASAAPPAPPVNVRPPAASWARWLDRSVTLVLVATLFLLAGRGLHWAWQRASPQGPAAAAQASGDGAQSDAQQAGPVTWTCSMHPNVRQPEPGKCPICAMDLIPAKSGDTAGPDGPIRFSPSAVVLMRVQTVPVARKPATATVDMLGRVAYDETRTATLSAWVPGRIERMYVDFTGMSVREGDHMVDLYSPELLAAQEELIQAFKTLAELGEDASELVRDSAVATARAARQKLRLMGLTGEQVGKIISAGEPMERLTIYAPAGGVVTHKLKETGAYVQTGSAIYRIADLSQVWVELEAYESDLMWLRLGQPVRFSAEAYPGETFSGRISFISPEVDPKRRTVRVRVTAPNDHGRLKPGMYVRAGVSANVAAGGKVVDASLAGKWMCPMHPSQIADGPADCEICSMPLEPAESLGYASVQPDQVADPLVVPVSAVLRTGRRSVAYVEKREGDQIAYELREVVLGPRAGQVYLVRDGLSAGEQVVVRGNFKIDSERQLRGMTSMMSVGADLPEPGPGESPLLVTRADQPARFREALDAVYEAYFAAQAALADDDPAAASAALSKALTAARQVDASSLPAQVQDVARKNLADLTTLLTPAAGAGELAELRKRFYPLSRQMTVLTRHFGGPGSQPVHLMLCPMAFDNRGATWLQPGREIANPYFGEQMLRCGEIKETLGGAQTDGDGRPDTSAPAPAPLHNH